MTIPKTIQGLAGPIRIRMVDDLHTEDDTWGCAVFERREIIVKQGMDPTQLVLVLFHELFHFAAYDSGFAQTLNREQEETLCNLVGTMVARSGLVRIAEE